MIKALRCTGYGHLNLFLPETLEACRERHMALPKGARTKRICVRGGGFCDAEPLAVTPWAKHEEVQAALAAAGEVIRDAVEDLKYERYYDGLVKRLRETHAKIRKVKE